MASLFLLLVAILERNIGVILFISNNFGLHAVKICFVILEQYIISFYHTLCVIQCPEFCIVAKFSAI